MEKNIKDVKTSVLEPYLCLCIFCLQTDALIKCCQHILKNMLMCLCVCVYRCVHTPISLCKIITFIPQRASTE